MAELLQITKLDSSRHMAFGYANVSIAKDGRLITDLQGDIIPPTVLEDAAYNFVLDYRESGEMHEGVAKGRLVESFMITTEKLAAMGIEQEVTPRWWVGFQFDEPTFEKVKKGVYKMFSIQGSADYVEVDDGAGT